MEFFENWTDETVLDKLHEGAEKIRTSLQPHQLGNGQKGMDAYHRPGKQYAPVALEAFKRFASIVRLNPYLVMHRLRDSERGPDDVEFWEHIDAITCLDESIEKEKYYLREVKHGST